MSDPENLNGPTPGYVRDYQPNTLEHALGKLEGKTDQLNSQITSKGTLMSVYAGLVALFILAGASWVNHRVGEVNARLEAMNENVMKIVAYQAVAEERFQAVRGIYQAVVGKPFVGGLPVKVEAE